MTKSEKAAAEAAVEGLDAASTVRRLVEIVAEHNLAELDVEVDGVRVTIKGAAAAVAAPMAVLHPAPMPIPHHAARPVHAIETPVDKRSGLIALEAPMVGVFYRASAPDDPPYVSEGDTVRVNQIIGTIEAMKTFNDVPAERAGRVVEIVAQNGKIVEIGDPILYLEAL